MINPASPPQKVYLSSLEDTHLRRYLELSHDPDLVDTMGWEPFQADDKERFLRVALVLTLPYCGDGPPVIFSIVSAGDDTPIGYVCLKGINKMNSSVELGIAVMEPEYRSQGYGTAALKLALDYAFQEMGVSRVGLTVFPSNTRAIRAYEKTGFRRKEVLNNSWLMPDGEYADMLLMEARCD